MRNQYKIYLRNSYFFHLTNISYVIPIMWKGYVIKFLNYCFLFHFFFLELLLLESVPLRLQPTQRKKITSLSRKLFIVRISPVYLLMINIGESEGSCLMILKAIFEFKLFGSSASVALSTITSVSRNQEKLIANGQFAFLL